MVQHGISVYIYTDPMLDHILSTVIHCIYTLYNKPIIMSTLGRSDHNMVMLSSLHTGSTQQVTVRCMGHNEKATFSRELSAVRWEPLYLLQSCDDQFRYYQEVMDTLMDHCFPYKTVTRHTDDKPWVTDSFRQLVRKRQRARMSGDHTLCRVSVHKKLCNYVA